MTEHPIIFSGPMVLALLAGRKTMTRRLAFRFSKDGLSKYATKWQAVRPGDRLWVRETLTHVTSDPVTAQPCSVHCYTANIPAGMESANPYEPNYLFAEDGAPALKPRGIPSIHMPRWASRLTLIVTATKVEPLQAISEADVLAEGISQKGIERHAEWFDPKDCPGIEFGLLWDSLHGKGAWDTNPEVVALTFTIAPSPGGRE